MRIRALAGAAVAALLLTLVACASPGSGTQTPDVSPPVGPAPSGSFTLGTPPEFLDRHELPPCGHITLDQGEQLPTRSFECILNPGAEGAELIVTQPTTEGDPIVTYYRALPGDGIEIYTDMTRDSFGGGWWYTTCVDAVSIDDLGECTEPRELRTDHEMDH